MASYEEIRQRNIESNRKLLLSLKLAGPGSEPIIPKPKPATKPKPAASSRQSLRGDQGVDDADPSASPVDSGLSRRRSGRIQKIKAGLKSASTAESNDPDYQSKGESSQEDDDADSPKKRKSRPKPATLSNSATKRPRQAPKARSLKGGRPDPKIFGHQVGVEVGDWWDSRMSCSQAGVHAPPVSGISGSESEGCWSVALSGGYEDDVDIGYAFTFTGAGGRALSGTKGSPKNLRTAPQTFDQEFTSLNASLRTSAMTKKPVRVIRGFKNHSPFAPDDGYRYDGLYQVERCWREVGQAGFQVCKYAFVRLPDQPRIPVKAGRESEAEQMYKDMGFVIDQLPPSPQKRPVWTKKMATDRLRASPSSVEAKFESEAADEAPAPDDAQMDVDELAKGDGEPVSRGPQEDSATEGVTSVLNDMGKDFSSAAQQDGELKPEDTQPTDAMRDSDADKKISDTGKEHEASKREDTQPVNDTESAPQVPDDAEMDLGQVANEDGEPVSESPEENPITEALAPVSNDVVKDVSNAVKQGGELKAEDTQPANSMPDLGSGKEISEPAKEHEASKPEDTQPVNITENAPRVLDDAKMNVAEVVNEDSDLMPAGPQKIPMPEGLAPALNDAGKGVSDPTTEEGGSQFEVSQPAKAEDPGPVLDHAHKDISERPNEEGQSKLEDTELANVMDDLASVLDSAPNHIGEMAKEDAESKLEHLQPVDQTGNLISVPNDAGIYLSDTVKEDGEPKLDDLYSSTLMEDLASVLDKARKEIGETAKEDGQPKPEGIQLPSQTEDVARIPNDAGVDLCGVMMKENAVHKAGDAKPLNKTDVVAPLLDDLDMFVRETLKEDGHLKCAGDEAMNEESTTGKADNMTGRLHTITEPTSDKAHSFSDAIQSTTVQENFF